MRKKKKIKELKMEVKILSKKLDELDYVLSEHLKIHMECNRKKNDGVKHK